MRGIVICTIVVVTSSLTLSAQAVKSLVYLERSSVTGIPVKESFAVALPMKCGTDGAIYVRFAGAGMAPVLTVIGEDGANSMIALNKVSELADNTLYDFAPGDGEVFVLSSGRKPREATTYYISRFKKDGTYIGSAKVDTSARPDFEPRQIAAFAQGSTLLISGIAKGNKSAFASFTALFGIDGTFQREVTLEEDLRKVLVEASGQASGHSSESQFSDEDKMRNLLDVSYVVGSDDGNVYMLRHTAKGPVFVVSPGGLARKVNLKPPVERANLEWILASGGTIVAQYRSIDPKDVHVHYLLLVDADTKRTTSTVRYIHDYRTNGGGMACYQHGTFTFLAGGSDNFLQLVKAVAQ